MPRPIRQMYSFVINRLWRRRHSGLPNKATGLDRFKCSYAQKGCNILQSIFGLMFVSDVFVRIKLGCTKNAHDFLTKNQRNSELFYVLKF